MKKVNLDVLVDEVIKHNKSVDKHNSNHNNEKKDKITLAEVVSKNMVENINKYKEK